MPLLLVLILLCSTGEASGGADPHWGETARKLTQNHEGVHHIVEMGGQGTMTQSLHAIRMEGVISVIGILSGGGAKDDIISTLSHLCTVRGVYVGSREQMEDMIKTMEAHDIHPVLNDKIFTLETAKDAYEYMWARKHFGKVGIKID